MTDTLPLQPGAHLYYPGLGVGTVVGVRELELGDEPLEVLVLRSISQAVTVQIPLTNLEDLGVRPLVSKGRLQRMLDALRSPTPISAKRATWNQRFRTYTEKIQSGQPGATCEVLAELHQIRLKKGSLSFGERRMYDKVWSFLISEVAIVRQVDEAEAEKLLESVLEAGAESLKACA
jgi:CarD family transcriptional regulator